jgi:diadenosine tetraphosphate (Ap4A) HIT family hydrolase
MDDGDIQSCSLCNKILHYQERFTAELVWEFPRSIAFLGPWQYFEGYCIVVAKKHITELFDAAPTERSALIDEVSQMAQAVHQVVQPRKINYEWLGNQVPHMHWHLFPRQEGDPNKLKAVWMELEGVEFDSQKKARMEFCQRGRSKLIQELHARLHDICR